MKLLNVLDLGVAVELWPDDCLAIADALGEIAGDAARPANHPHIKALQTAFESLAILAASDTNLDEDTPAREWRVKTWRVWGPINTTSTAHERLTEPRQSPILAPGRGKRGLTTGHPGSGGRSACPAPSAYVRLGTMGPRGLADS